MPDPFWTEIEKQLDELKTAATATDVTRILSAERNPYGHTSIAEDGFFAGSGGDDTVEEALLEAGWSVVSARSSIHYTMQAPDGSQITYIEGDIRILPRA